ncbi:arsenic resistance protein [Desulfuribacillus alkaliarsenatis]|uniref:Bile acid:sodium symporter n=1 Tax=Desulfuribacillus alkaliarsenatis TaxID=766136 RepID=A0A1E5G656_9FIRM|nr:bile acid:sodium symporter [Desulfuribacillus alkaliarsenatis]OEF98662.1 hypothetical protein BHF68_03100 [Desulfuribacillus alkaliarsenatis]
MQRLFTFPSQNLHLVIPLSMILGVFLGIFVNTEQLRAIILPLTFVMVVSAMLGFPWRALFHRHGNKILCISLVINFIIVPFVAWLTITIFPLTPEMAIGFIFLAALPTSSMSIIWTVLAKGNVQAAVRMSTVGLLIGSFLLPIYLFFIVGQTIAIPLKDVFLSIVLMVILPLLISQVVQKFLAYNKYDNFQRITGYYLPNINSWLLSIIILLNISLQVEGLIQYKQQIVVLIFAFTFFYILTFSIATIISKKWFNKEDGIALVYGTAIRHLTISLGITIAAFGGITVFVITFAYVFQAQAAAWYGKIANKYIWKSAIITENSNITN